MKLILKLLSTAMIPKYKLINSLRWFKRIFSYFVDISVEMNSQNIEINSNNLIRSKVWVPFNVKHVIKTCN